MRIAVTILLASAVGIHCGASEQTGDPSAALEEPSASSPAAPISNQEQNQNSAPSASSGSDGRRDDTAPRWASAVEGPRLTLITSTVRGDDNALYATGVFRNSVTVGEQTIESRGEEDVLLARFEPNGKLAWIRGIGSIRSESGPRVAFEDGTVKLIAETKGEVDCGSGKLGKWSSAMFFYCLFGTDGSAVGGGTFPTGSP